MVHILTDIMSKGLLNGHIENKILQEIAWISAISCLQIMFYVCLKTQNWYV